MSKKDKKKKKDKDKKKNKYPKAGQFGVLHIPKGIKVVDFSTMDGGEPDYEVIDKENQR